MAYAYSTNGVIASIEVSNSNFVMVQYRCNGLLGSSTAGTQYSVTALNLASTGSVILYKLDDHLIVVTATGSVNNAATRTQAIRLFKLTGGSGTPYLVEVNIDILSMIQIPTLTLVRVESVHHSTFHVTICAQYIDGSSVKSKKVFVFTKDGDAGFAYGLVNKVMVGTTDVVVAGTKGLYSVATGGTDPAVVTLNSAGEVSDLQVSREYYSTSGQIIYAITNGASKEYVKYNKGAFSNTIIDTTPFGDM
jgi:hypothetical protein